MQERALARPRRSHDRGERPRREPDGDPVQRDDLPIALAVDLANVAKGDHGRGGSSCANARGRGLQELFNAGRVHAPTLRACGRERVVARSPPGSYVLMISPPPKVGDGAEGRAARPPGRPVRRATSRPACHPGARPRGGGRSWSVDTPAVAISQAIIEFEFHISPAFSSSRPHTGRGTVRTR